MILTKQTVDNINESPGIRTYFLSKIIVDNMTNIRYPVYESVSTIVPIYTENFELRTLNLDDLAQKTCYTSTSLWKI